MRKTVLRLNCDALPHIVVAFIAPSHDECNEYRNLSGKREKMYKNHVRCSAFLAINFVIVLRSQFSSKLIPNCGRNQRNMLNAAQFNLMLITAFVSETRTQKHYHCVQLSQQSFILRVNKIYLLWAIHFEMSTMGNKIAKLWTAVK